MCTIVEAGYFPLSKKWVLLNWAQMGQEFGVLGIRQSSDLKSGRETNRRLYLQQHQSSKDLAHYI